MIEYVLLATLLAGVSIFTIGNVGANADDLFSVVNNSLGESNIRPSKPPVPGDDVPKHPELEGVSYYIVGTSVSPEYKHFGDIDLLTDDIAAHYSTGKDQGTLIIYPRNGISGFVERDLGMSAPWSYYYNQNVTNIYFAPGVKIKDQGFQLVNGFSDIETINVKNLDTANCTSMSEMFIIGRCKTPLDLTSFNTSNVTDMSKMFDTMSDTGYTDSLFTEIKLSTWDTRKVTNMSRMFAGQLKLETINLSNFRTSSTQNFSYMFQCCEAIENLNLSNFDTSKATDFSNMFENCGVKVLNLSNFDTSNANDMSNMFSSLWRIESITIGEKFSFSGNGSIRQCSFPDGQWKAESDGQIYDADSIPNNKADTYAKMS